MSGGRSTRANRRRSLTGVLGLLALYGLCCSRVFVRAQGVEKVVAPTAEVIASRLALMDARRAAALQSYEGRRLMTLTYKGLLTQKHASQAVLMTYKAPGIKSFTVVASTGSPLLRESVFAREIESEQEAVKPEVHHEAALTPANYTLQLLGEDHLAQGDCYVLSVAPKTKSKFAYEGKVWIQVPDYAVVRIQGRPAERPSFWVKDGSFTSEYMKVGDFWLPSETVSTSRVRLGGEASFAMHFGPYRILSAQPVDAP